MESDFWKGSAWHKTSEMLWIGIESVGVFLEMISAFATRPILTNLFFYFVEDLKAFLQFKGKGILVNFSPLALTLSCLNCFKCEPNKRWSEDGIVLHAQQSVSICKRISRWCQREQAAQALNPIFFHDPSWYHVTFFLAQYWTTENIYGWTKLQSAPPEWTLSDRVQPSVHVINVFVRAGQH